jgi:pentatricopeptide repeat protein
MLLNNNRYSYHTTLVALSKEQQFDKAFEVFAAMKEDGVLPDATVYRYIYIPYTFTEVQFIYMYCILM